MPIFAIQRMQQGFEKLANPKISNYVGYGIPDASTGFDNKNDYIQSLINQGAIYSDGTPLSAGVRYGQSVYVPPENSKPGEVIRLVDNNPEPHDMLADIIPYLAIGLPLGAAALSAGGLFGGAAAETAAGSTLADLYGAATNMSVAAAPTAATEGLLYQAATGALPAAGGFAVGNATSPLYQAATGTSVPAGVPDVVGNTLVNQSQYGSLLQSVPEGAVNAFGQPLGQAMSTTPELSQGLLSQAYANGVTPASTSLWDKLLNGKMPTSGIPTGGMPTGTASGGDDTYTPGPIDQGILGQYGHAVQPGGIMYQGFKTLTPMEELYQQRINKLKGIL